MLQGVYTEFLKFQVGAGPAALLTHWVAALGGREAGDDGQETLGDVGE